MGVTARVPRPLEGPVGVLGASVIRGGPAPRAFPDRATPEAIAREAAVGVEPSGVLMDGPAKVDVATKVAVARQRLYPL